MNASFIIFMLFFMLVVLTAFYIWRRINGLESYNKILEKKINHLKKDNKELRELLYGNDEIDAADMAKNADLIMNKIFNTDVMYSTSHAAPDLKEVSIADNDTSTKITCNDDKCTIQETSDIVQNIIAESIDTESDKAGTPAISLPVAEQDNDIESVISDAVNGNALYNRKKLSKMNLDKLKEICNSMHLPPEGSKNVLIDKILSNLTIE